MHTPQSGIFALGTPSHAYLEFDLTPGKRGRDLVSAILSFREPHTTVGGVNLVVGFRPELWREYAPNDIPAGVHGFYQNIVGLEGFCMPATQHDAVLWIAGSSYDVVFDVSHKAIEELDGLASVADETSSWPYHGFHDLTGFIDGTENPSVIDAPGVVLVPEGEPGASGSILLLQKWPHNRAKWEAVPVNEQELIIGRRKPDSEELEDKPEYAHAARTDQDEFGKIFRRNMPYGTVTDHGTMFVGFSADQKRLHDMLESMAGLKNGVRDALTKYTRAISGAYYFVPSAESLRQPEDGTVLESKKS
jgi:putative iron-dependent peroxidase